MILLGVRSIFSAICWMNRWLRVFIAHWENLSLLKGLRTLIHILSILLHIRNHIIGLFLKLWLYILANIPYNIINRTWSQRTILHILSTLLLILASFWDDSMNKIGSIIVERHLKGFQRNLWWKWFLELNQLLSLILRSPLECLK